jgi:hypothetical protein
MLKLLLTKSPTNKFSHISQSIGPLGKLNKSIFFFAGLQKPPPNIKSHYFYYWDQRNNCSYEIERMTTKIQLYFQTQLKGSTAPDQDVSKKYWKSVGRRGIRDNGSLKKMITEMIENNNRIEASLMGMIIGLKTDLNPLFHRKVIDIYDDNIKIRTKLSVFFNLPISKKQFIRCLLLYQNDPDAIKFYNNYDATIFGMTDEGRKLYDSNRGNDDFKFVFDEILECEDYLRSRYDMLGYLFGKDKVDKCNFVDGMKDLYSELSNDIHASTEKFYVNLNQRSSILKAIQLKLLGSVARAEDIDNEKTLSWRELIDLWKNYGKKKK